MFEIADTRSAGGQLALWIVSLQRLGTLGDRGARIDNELF
jgi:hypothetical protein